MSKPGAGGYDLDTLRAKGISKLAAGSLEFGMPAIKDTVIKGGYFNFGNAPYTLLQNGRQNGMVQAVGNTTGEYNPAQFDYVAPNGDVWGNLPTGPNGPNWNTNGSSAVNPYVPGTFQNALGGSPYVLGTPDPLTPDQFRRRYLPGLDQIFSFLGSPEEANDTIKYYWNVAVGDLESRLGMFIYPRLIVCDGVERGFRPGVDYDLEEREMDFNAREFYNWGWMKLRYAPIMQILQINMVYPTGQEILNFPPAWIKPQPLSGQVRLVPPQGALSQVVLGPGGYLVMLVGGMFSDMPALLFTDYIAGMWPIPDVLIQAIAMQAAIHLFTMAGDALAQGHAETRGAFETEIQETHMYVTRSDHSPFESRIRRYQKEIDRIVTQWLGWVSRPQLVVL